MGYPEKCDICLNDRVLTRFGQRNLQLAVRPFRQVRDAKVMLVGLNPTLIRKEARVVLDLDDAYSQICRFVAGDVLKPAGIDLNKHVYATNLVKCTFSKEPRIMSKEEAGKDGNEAVKSSSSLFSGIAESILRKKLVRSAQRSSSHLARKPIN
jgi:hypothetical protein